MQSLNEKARAAGEVLEGERAQQFLDLCLRPPIWLKTCHIYGVCGDPSELPIECSPEPPFLVNVPFTAFPKAISWLRFSLKPVSGTTDVGGTTIENEHTRIIPPPSLPLDVDSLVARLDDEWLSIIDAPMQ